MLKVNVEIYESEEAFEAGKEPIHEYTMNHDNPQERQTLGIKCRMAFEAGNFVCTYSKGKKNEA
jgi:hypothetical protein